MKKVSRDSYCNCLFYSAGALTRVLNKMAEDAFSPIGLSPSHAFVLMSVIKKPGIQPTELSEILMLAPSTVTRVIEKLEHKGMAERRGDAKETFVYATGRGMKLEGKLKKSWTDLFDKYVGVLGEESAKQLTSATFEATLKLEMA